MNYGTVLYNAKIEENTPPNLTIQTRLIHEDKVISETSPEPVSIKDQKDLQRIDLFGRIDLEKNLPPGNYIFQIIVTDKLAKKNTQIATQLIDFEVLNK